MIRLAGNVTHLREQRKTYRILLGKPEGMKSFGRTRRMCEGNIKVGRREIEWTWED